MRKQALAFSLILLVVLCLPLKTGASQTSLGYVTDSAGLLTKEEAANLASMAQRISEEYNFGVYIVTMEDFTSGGQQDLFQYAISFYDGYRLGWGSDHVGTMLMLSMADRDYHLHFNGEKADRVFSEYARDILEEDVVDYLRKDDYYGAFYRYLELCEYDLRQEAEGTPVEAPEGRGIGWLALIPGALAAVIVGAILCAPMHTAKIAASANDYVVDGSLHLTQSSDTFLHRTVTRQQREQASENSSSGGGSSMHSGSHSGRSGKF